MKRDGTNTYVLARSLAIRPLVLSTNDERSCVVNRKQQTAKLQTRNTVIIEPTVVTESGLLKAIGTVGRKNSDGST